MAVYYNENDAEKAAWLRELIRRNIVAPGEVDERSITEIEPNDLRGFTQCHFFAGIGVWSYSLRLAGWTDDRPVWTGSCPCPSFSAAGKGGGFNDPRHLWPAWYRLVPECRPATIFGEQADDAIGYGWLDLVQTDLERADYAVGKAVLGACSVGAPHIRQRCYFVGHQLRSESAGRGCAPGRTGQALLGKESRRQIERSGLLVECSDATEARRADAGEYRSGSPSFSARPVERSGTEQRSDTAQTRRPSDTDGQQHIERARANGNERREGLRTSSVRHGDAGQRSNSNGRLPRHSDLQRSGEQRLLAQDGGTGERANSGCASRHAEHGHESGSEIRRGASTADDSRSGPSGKSVISSDSTQRGLPMRGSAPGNAGHFALASESGIGPDSEESGRGARLQDDDARESHITGRNEFSLGSQPISARLEGHFGDVRDWRGPGWLDPHEARSVAEAGATRGFWGDCDWWHARDEKYRPIGPGIFPLAHGATRRVLKLRGYGDAICAEVAKEFIVANMELDHA